MANRFESEDTRQLRVDRERARKARVLERKGARAAKQSWQSTAVDIYPGYSKGVSA